ncbi:glycosyltransferase [Tenacibaculum singaporense]|uniref:Glycosyltransferase n=1 Tax=Tenacibaculum singaporense TaxID=2358479 RepID=A0A3S8R5J7_9FLAO|nr:glycosyltransferase [Tenacibaculum singaporense]AZJ35034.1 glycosyltransferase [Tenacibaculum singaporense]
MGKSKVVLVTDSFNSGGAQKQLVNLANGLEESKKYSITTVQYYKYSFFENLLSKDIKVVKVITENKIIRIYKLVLFFYREKPDIIISFLHGPNNYSAIYKLLFFWRKVHLIVGERNLNINDLKMKDFLIRFSHLVANNIVCNSYAQQDRLLPYYGTKLSVIPNGTTTEGIEKKKDFSKSDICRLIVPARFIDQKNPLGLLDAINEVENIQVDWYGEVFKDYSVYKQALDLIEKNNLNKKIRILVPTSDIYNVMTKYDAMILPSFYEGCPNAVIDAMLCGVPILASDVSDNKIYLDTQKELLFNPYLKEDIIDKINLFKSMNVEKRTRIGEMNYKISRNFFNKKTMVENYISLFDQNNNN